ncbi:histidinol phosphate phosphatase H [Pluteus cervinus]|uniref:Histidinol phosphate phosphatase H n=1 Tax=Pluteus cervinus TaxID=181527 RepID=A0ACD3AZV4_9AGAR|nr:histidinol phosphate phosphatase H [Pluteus cervinus]
MPHSHHSHSGQFCKHAVGTLEEVVVEAIRQEFKVYGLTEHMPRYRPEDLYPEEEGLTTEALVKQFEDYLIEAHRLKAKYASQITLLVGLETELIRPSDLDNLDVLLDNHPDRIDYIVGSIHHVNGVPIDFDLPTFQRALHSSGLETEYDARAAFFVNYFEAQYNLFCRFQPEIIGHFDLCRLYNPNLSFEDYPSAWDLIERNIIYAATYGALFEVNGAAFRKNWDTAYPGRGVIQLIIKHGGRFALSDDSHGPRAVGLNYHRVAKYLQSIGVSELWYLQKSDLANPAGRNVRAVRLEGNWWEDQFWQKRLE